MSFYADMATLMSDMLSDFGMDVTLTRTTGATPKLTSTGTAVAGTSTTYTPKGIVKNMPGSMIDGSRILSGDKLVYLDDTVLPLPSDEITFHGQTWNLEEIQEFKPAATTIGYMVRVRR